MNNQSIQPQEENSLVLAIDSDQAQVIDQSIELNWEQLESIAGGGFIMAE